MIKDKYITSIVFRIGKETITADEAKKIMNKREYKIGKSNIDRVKGENNYEKQ